MTPDAFAQIIQSMFNTKNIELKIRPEQINNIKIKDITEEEIIIKLEYEPIPFWKWIFEITTPKLKNIEPVEGACEHFMIRPFHLKMVES